VTLFMEDMHVLGEDSSLLSYNTLSCFISNTSKHAFIPISWSRNILYQYLYYTRWLY